LTWLKCVKGDRTQMFLSLTDKLLLVIFTDAEIIRKVQRKKRSRS
jgi:hypothetical protein